MDPPPVPGPSHQVSWAPDPPNSHNSPEHNGHTYKADGANQGQDENGWESLLLPKGRGENDLRLIDSATALAEHCQIFVGLARADLVDGL